MTERLQPCVLRLYDEASTTAMLKRVLGLDAQGACFIVGFDGWAEIAAAQERRAHCDLRELGGEDLGREPGEHWWEHRYDFYYPPLALALPKLYGTTDTVCTFDKIERLYCGQEARDRARFRRVERALYRALLALVSVGRDGIRPLCDRRAARRIRAKRYACTTGSGRAAARTSLEHGGVLNEHHGIGWKLGRLMREQHGAAWPVLERIKAGGRPARNYESRQAGVWGRDQRIGVRGQESRAQRKRWCGVSPTK